MNTHLQKVEDQPLAAQFTPEQMQLITSTVAKGASPQELQLFLYRCKLMGLNPLKPGQIHFVKYGNSPGTIVVGIEGFRSIAARTGKLSGISRGALKDEKGKLIGAWAEVHRKDWSNPAREEVSLHEYDTGKAMWAKMPETMIKKVAEAAALRMAFPDDLGGVYEQSEMEQAANSKDGKPLQPWIQQPTDEEIGPKSDVYLIPFGQWKQRTLEQVVRDNGTEKLLDYCDYLRDSAAKKGVEITGQVLEFIGNAEAYVREVEGRSDNG